ncbi:MAG: metalloregulator ArsR/SmtB family transcription factor [bacterium]
MPEVKALRALGDENRLRAVLALQKRELCVCQIVELLQLAHSTVSKHMSVLRQAGLVESRKSGRWVYYRLREGGFCGLSESVLSEILSTATRAERATKDSQRLEEILRLHPEQLCERQRGC